MRKQRTLAKVEQSGDGDCESGVEIFDISSEMDRAVSADSSMSYSCDLAQSDESQLTCIEFHMRT